MLHTARLGWLTAALAAAVAIPALAGDFGVSPIRVELDRATKSALVTVSNDDSRPLAFQVRALEWTQDENGADRYTETTDLVYFPQQFKIAPNENRVVRLGYKVPASQGEKTYRLFIEELADATRPPSQTGIAVTLRFGVPVFSRPASPTSSGDARIAVSARSVRAVLKNTGNVHFRPASVRLVGLGAAGDTLFDQTLDGWYLLAGTERPYSFTLPPEVCPKLRTLRLEAPAEKLVLRAERPLEPEDCR
jgi:fimbrial chaperone protein